MQSSALMRPGDRLTVDGIRGGKKIRYRILVNSDRMQDGSYMVLYGTIGGGQVHTAYLLNDSGLYSMWGRRKSKISYIFKQGEVV